MKKSIMLSILVLSILALCCNTYAGDTHSEQSVKHGSEAASHGSASAAHAIAGSGQATSAAIAVPLSVAGSSGAVSTEIAEDLMKAATAPVGKPLEITDETFTTGPPPNEALNVNKNSDLIEQ